MCAFLKQALCNCLDITGVLYCDQYDKLSDQYRLKEFLSHIQGLSYSLRKLYGENEISWSAAKIGAKYKLKPYSEEMTRRHLQSLVDLGLIKQTQNGYRPISTSSKFLLIMGFVCNEKELTDDLQMQTLLRKLKQPNNILALSYLIDKAKLNYGYDGEFKVGEKILNSFASEFNVSDRTFRMAVNLFLKLGLVYLKNEFNEKEYSFKRKFKGQSLYLDHDLVDSVIAKCNLPVFTKKAHVNLVEKAIDNVGQTEKDVEKLMAAIQNKSVLNGKNKEPEEEISNSEIENETTKLKKVLQEKIAVTEKNNAILEKTIKATFGFGRLRNEQINKKFREQKKKSSNLEKGLAETGIPIAETGTPIAEDLTRPFWNDSQPLLIKGYEIDIFPACGKPKVLEKN